MFVSQIQGVYISSFLLLQSWLLFWLSYYSDIWAGRLYELVNELQHWSKVLSSYTVDSRLEAYVEQNLTHAILTIAAVAWLAIGDSLRHQRYASNFYNFIFWRFRSCFLCRYHYVIAKESISRKTRYLFFSVFQTVTIPRLWEPLAFDLVWAFYLTDPTLKVPPVLRGELPKWGIKQWFWTWLKHTGCRGGWSMRKLKQKW